MKPILTERCTVIPLSEADLTELAPLLTSTEVRRYLGGARAIEGSLDGLRRSMQTENEYPDMMKGILIRRCGE